MSRQVVYHKDDNRYRLASFPGGVWQFQRHDGTKGNKRGVKSLGKVSHEVLEVYKGDFSKIPHNDPWKPLRRATDWLTAKVQLDTLVPPKELTV